MTLWLIRPRDPLVLRDGRPFGPDPGARATSLAFPFPSTTAGAVRTRYGLANGGFGERGVDLAVVKKWYVRGPLLVKLDGETVRRSLLLPRPQDALLLRPEETNLADPEYEKADKGQANQEKAVRLWLRPLSWEAGAMSNLPPTLSPIGAQQPRMAKPIEKALPHWQWEIYRQWLISPGDDEVALTDLGDAGPTRESRMHVRVNLETQTAVEGMLFQTSGMEFIQPGKGASWWQVGKSEEMGLLVETDAPLTAGIGLLGGEGRMVAWQGINETLPECPTEIKDSVLKHEACRLILATPAHFAAQPPSENWGHLPNFDWLIDRIPGLKVEIKGAIVQGMEVVSGWSYEKPTGPKKSRRLVPAGSVFYLSLARSSAEAIQAFLSQSWLQSISDQPQDRLDGFGLALVGNWNGILSDMRLEESYESQSAT